MGAEKAGSCTVSQAWCDVPSLLGRPSTARAATRRTKARRDKAALDRQSAGRYIHRTPTTRTAPGRKIHRPSSLPRFTGERHKEALGAGSINQCDNLLSRIYD